MTVFSKPIVSSIEASKLQALRLLPYLKLDMERAKSTRIWEEPVLHNSKLTMFRRLASIFSLICASAQRNRSPAAFQRAGWPQTRNWNPSYPLSLTWFFNSRAWRSLNPSGTRSRLHTCRLAVLRFMWDGTFRTSRPARFQKEQSKTWRNSTSHFGSQSSMPTWRCSSWQRMRRRRRRRMPLWMGFVWCGMRMQPFASELTRQAKAALWSLRVKWSSERAEMPSFNHVLAIVQGTKKTKRNDKPNQWSMYSKSYWVDSCCFSPFLFVCCFLVWVIMSHRQQGE